MKRREFIKDCGFICFGTIGGSLMLQGCASNYYALSTTENNKITIKKTEFVSIKKGKTENRKYILVKIEAIQFPIFLYKQNDNEFTALLMNCTHKGCELQPHGEYLICPCHGSEFNNRGKVQNPPADEDLKQYKTFTDNENIYIQL